MVLRILSKHFIINSVITLAERLRETVNCLLPTKNATRKYCRSTRKNSKINIWVKEAKKLHLTVVCLPSCFNRSLLDSFCLVTLYIELSDGIFHYSPFLLSANSTGHLMDFHSNGKEPSFIYSKKEGKIYTCSLSISAYKAISRDQKKTRIKRNLSVREKPTFSVWLLLMNNRKNRRMGQKWIKKAAGGLYDPNNKP